MVSKILYTPLSVGLGIGAGIVARKGFDAIWDKLDGSGDGPPSAGDQEASVAKVAAAAALPLFAFEIWFAIRLIVVGVRPRVGVAVPEGAI